MSFGVRLRELRLRKDLSQKDFAEMLGVKQASVTRYEKDVNFPSRSVLKTIIEKLEADSNWLFTGISFVDNPRVIQPVISNLFVRISGNISRNKFSNAPTSLIRNAVQKLKSKLDEYEQVDKGLDLSALLDIMVLLQMDYIELISISQKQRMEIQELQSKVIKLLEEKQ